MVDEWVSGDTVHVITGIADGMYTPTEKRAPKGYEVAESIEFEVKNGEAVGGTVVMEDRESEATPSEPEKPDKPEKPATPSEPEKPSTPTHQQHQILRQNLPADTATAVEEAADTVHDP